MSTFIHGIAASENIDSSGECVRIAGLDISSLAVDGTISYEHEQAEIPDKDGKQIKMQVKVPSQVIGKILKAHKIFSEKDCQDAHQLYFWNKVKTPYVYIMGELFDDYTEAAKDIAGKFRYDADKKGQNTRTVMNFSVEGNVLPKAKEGMMVTRSIARKVTITSFPCNKAAIAEMISQSAPPSDDISSIFKTEPACEIEIFKFETNYGELVKKEERSRSGSELSKSAPTWSSPKRSKDGSAVHFSHPEHGIVSVHKQPTGEFHVKHQGRLAGHGGVAGNFPSAGAAGKHAKGYMTAISQKKVLAPKMHNRPSPQMPKMGKALDAGSAMAAPAQLVQVSALSRKSKKSKWLMRAEAEYENWAKREQFEQYMQKKLPHLNKAEIKAIGQTLALQKSLKLEKALSEIVSEYKEKEDK